MRGYPRLFGWFLFIAAGGLLLTGLLLVPSMLDFRLEMDVPWRLGMDARVTTATLHAAASFLMLMIIGAIWSVHMRGHWRKKKHRVSGSLLVGSFGLMAATGLGIYYFGDEGLSLGSSVLHVAAGLLGTGVFTWHAILGYRIWRERKAREQARKTPLRLVARREEEEGADKDADIRKASGPNA